MKALIFGTCWIPDNNKLRIVKLWDKILSESGHDLLLVDCCSTLIRDESLSEYEYFKSDSSEIFDYTITKPKTIVSHVDNIGHLNFSKDGWGRAFCQGIHLAIQNGYDRVVHIESDLLYFTDIDRLLLPGPETISTIDPNHYFLETAMMSMSVKELQRINFIDKYDYKNSSKEYLPEKKTADILRENLKIANLKGMRVEGLYTREEIINNLHTYDFLTHFDADHEHEDEEILRAIEKNYENY